MDRFDGRTNRRVIDATNQLRRIHDRFSPLWSGARADASPVAPIAQDLEAALLRDTARIERFHSFALKRVDPGVRKQYLAAVRDVMRLGARVRARLPPEIKTISDAIEQMQTKREGAQETQALLQLQADPAYRKPIEQVLSGGAESIIAVVALIYFSFFHPRDGESGDEKDAR